MMSAMARPVSYDDPLEAVRLAPLMARTSGQPEVVVGLLDGPVAIGHPDLASERIREIPGAAGSCTEAGNGACQHGTFIAGILSARRGGDAPAICPGCSLLVRPIFGAAPGEGERPPGAAPEALAAAIGEGVDGGAWVLNLSAAPAQPSTRVERQLRDALDYAASRKVLVVAAVGNQGTLGSSTITRHPWVIPVVGYGRDGRPQPQSNLGSSAGRRGLGAPGEDVASLDPAGGSRTETGTSIAAAFVTGAIALLWSEFPGATAVEVKAAVARSRGERRTSVAPPLLDAWAAHGVLSETGGRRVKA
jgi:subtilisin family serine protease